MAETTDSLRHPRSELLAAEAALKAMRSAANFHELEHAWRDFLNHLEKVWIKTERACQDIRNQFQSWQAHYG